MTNQEMFDRVKTHLLTQMERAGEPNPSYVVENGSAPFRCFYHAPNGFKCAIGCLIPDEHYNRELEDKSVWNDNLQTAAGITREQAGFARRLQQCHDEVPVEYWALTLTYIAIEFGLQP